MLKCVNKPEGDAVRCQSLVGCGRVLMKCNHRTAALFSVATSQSVYGLWAVCRLEPSTIRCMSTAKVLAKCKLKY